MTAMTNPAGVIQRRSLLAVALAALLAGATGGSAATVLLVSAPAPRAEAGPMVVRPAPVDRSTTTAGEQYLDWHTRPSRHAFTTTAGDQYMRWYLRDAE